VDEVEPRREAQQGALAGPRLLLLEQRGDGPRPTVELGLG
jgi:hypothetical protein